LRIHLTKNIDFLTLPGQLGQERVGVGAHNPLADLVEDEDKEAHGDGDEPVLGGDGSAAKEALAGVDDDRGERDRPDGRGEQRRILVRRFDKDRVAARTRCEHVAAKLHHHERDKVDCLTGGVGDGLLGGREARILPQNERKIIKS